MSSTLRKYFASSESYFCAIALVRLNKLSPATQNVQLKCSLRTYIGLSCCNASWAKLGREIYLTRSGLSARQSHYNFCNLIQPSVCGDNCFVSPLNFQYSSFYWLVKPPIRSQLSLRI